MIKKFCIDKNLSPEDNWEEKERHFRKFANNMNVVFKLNHLEQYSISSICKK